MRIGSLFSGYGGLDLAALELFPGSQVWWHCEWDDAPSKILDHHWPGVPNYRDVTTVDWEQLPAIDILTGGYPCQPFSAAGQRKGTNDERHLWPYVRQAIRVLRPRYTLLENVAGHRSLGFDRVLGDMAEDGMHVRWTSVRASDVGACHHRERIFILVSSPDARREHGQWRQIAQCRESEVGHSSSEPQRPSSDSPQLLPTPKTTDSHHASPADLNRNSPGLRAIDGLLPTPTASDATGGGQHPDRREGHSRQLIDYALLDGSARWGEYAAAIRRHAHVLSREAPSPTQSSRKGNPQLAAAFAEWMMMLPEQWVTDPAIGITRNEQLKALGNGVVPPQAVAAFSSMLQAVAA